MILVNSDPPSEFNNREVRESSPWTLIRSDPFSVSNVVRVLWQHYVVPRISRWPVWLQTSVVTIVIVAGIGAVVVPTFFSNDEKQNGEDENAISKCGFTFDGFNAHQSVKKALERLAISHLQDEIDSHAKNNCALKDRHVYWGTLLSQSDSPEHSKVIDIEIKSSNPEIDIDPLLVVYPVPYSTENSTSVALELLNAIPGQIIDGIAVQEIELQESHKGAILMVCAGDVSQDDRVGQAALNLKLTNC